MLLKHSESLDEEKENGEKEQKIEKGPAKTTKVSDLVDDLTKNKSLIELVCTSLRHHIKAPIQFSTRSKGISLMRHISDETNVHCINIRNHLKLFKFIAKYSSFTFTEDILNEICKILLDTPEFMEHKDILYQWLKKLSKAEKNGCTIFDGFEVESFMDKLKEE